MKSFKVQKIKNVGWGTTVALVNVDCLNGVGAVTHTIRDCKLIQGDFGSFVASPSIKVKNPYENKSTGKMVEWNDVVDLKKGIRQELNDVVSNAYDVNQPEGQWYGDGIENTNTTIEGTFDDIKNHMNMPG